jgi:hypothetical protein
MTQENGTRQDELLAELLWLDAADPRRRRLLAEHPELIHRLEALESAAQGLDEAVKRDVERLEVLAADTGTRAEAEDILMGQRALARLRREVAVPAGGARASRRWVLYALGSLAAAGVLVVLLHVTGVFHQPGHGPSDRTMLNDGEGRVGASPMGTVERVERFEWTRSPSPGAVQRVRLWYDASSSGPADHESPSLTSPAWTPPADITRALGPEFRWAVVEQNPITGEQRTVLEQRVRVTDRRE